MRVFPGLLLALSLHLAVRENCGQVPALLGYQGRITVEQKSYSGAGLFKFALVNAQGSQTYWANSADANQDGEPDQAVTLAVSKGLYAVLLGDPSLPQMAVLPPAALSHSEVYLRVWFSDGKTFERLSPDQRLAAVAYAMMAGSVADQSITAAKLAPGLLHLTNLNGTLTSSQIPNLDASIISSGVLHPSRLPPVEASQIGGTLSVSQIPSLDAGKIASGVFAEARIPALPGSRIAAGSIPADRLAGIDASQIIGGTLDPARIPGLDATKVSSGVFSINRIPALDAAQVNTGSFGPDRIASLDASKISSGIFPLDRLPAIPPTQIFGPGTLSPSAIPPLDASKLPSNLAYRDTDLASATNVLGQRIDAEKVALLAQIGVLNNQMAALSAQITAVANNVSGGPLRGATVVSTSASDSALTSLGYEHFHTIPAIPWRDGSVSNAPSPRSRHTGVWTGTQFLVWGGLLSQAHESQQGGAYDPTLDNWTTVSTVNAPSARSGHEAVWTGQEMVVWGGYSASGYLNTGGRIGTNEALWKTLNTSGAPVAREGHIALWTGAAMLIWGGRNEAGILPHGGLYDPVSDAWSNVITDGAPEGSFAAAAVWADDRAIIWGGLGPNGLLNSGGQLRFLNGSPTAWEPLPVQNAPDSRSAHSAVWTGNGFIVWGGDANGTLLGDGRMFIPAQGVWKNISSTGAPAPRKNHLAVWTGTEMLIWGGEGESGALANGAAYHPVNDTWRPLSDTGSPTARTETTGAWTGTELIVFGGISGNQPLGTLERVNPEPPWHFYRKQ